MEWSPINIYLDSMSTGEKCNPIFLQRSDAVATEFIKKEPMVDRTWTLQKSNSGHIYLMESFRDQFFCNEELCKYWEAGEEAMLLRGQQGTFGKVGKLLPLEG